jgi:hypothetical protein
MIANECVVEDGHLRCHIYIRDDFLAKDLLVISCGDRSPTVFALVRYLFFLNLQS